MSELKPDIWIEVDTAALKHNFVQVRSAVPEATRVMAVVKGNGFGHGYGLTARAFAEAGADMLAVTRLDEALAIRNADIETPILLFAPIQPQNAEAATEASCEMTVTSIALAEAVSSAARKIGKTARVWGKIDTGMGRLGVSPSEAQAFLRDISDLPCIELAGVYTHFANVIEADLARTREQFRLFRELLLSLKSAGVDYGAASAANSAAILRLPESHLDMVRPGTLLYGQYPSQHVPHSLDLRPTWTLKSRVCDVRELPKGTNVGYGSEFVATRAIRTAVIPIGYAEGFTMVPEGPFYRQSLLKLAAKRIKRSLAVSIRGQKAPVLGRVAMQMTVVDVTDIPDVQVGDEVIIPALRIPTSPLIPRVSVDRVL